MNWKEILRQLDKTEERIIYSLMGASLAIMFFQVVSRYLFSYSLTWAEELVRIFFVWMTLMGISLACKYSMHICIDVTQLFLPQAVIRVINIIAGVISIFLGLFLAYLIIKIVGAQIRHPQYFSTMGWLPVWVMYVAGVLGMVGLAVRTAVYSVWPLLKNISPAGTDAPGADEEGRS